MKKINTNELPQLTGTEKQIQWAENIRAEKIAEFNESIDAGLFDSDESNEVRQEFAAKIKRDHELAVDKLSKANDGSSARYYENLIECCKVTPEECDAYFEYVFDKLQTEASAKWWIDFGREITTDYVMDTAFGRKLNENLIRSRLNWIIASVLNRICNSDLYGTYLDFCNWMETKKEEEKIDSNPSALMAPEEIKTPTRATVTYSDKKVEVASDKDEVVIAACKNAGCKWDGSVWYRRFYSSITDPVDAAAEVVNKLLMAGVTVFCEDADVRRKAVDGDYDPIPTRVISGGTERPSLFIGWSERNEKIYQDARKIKGSKWEDRHVVVPASSYLDIEGFAEKWGFVLTQAAQEHIDNARTEIAAATVKVKKGREYKPNEFDGKAVLKSEAAVMDKHIIR